jgi:hypothetical protein
VFAEGNETRAIRKEDEKRISPSEMKDRLMRTNKEELKTIE